ncbi:hypothetical protein [Bacillus cereus]|nr:hypothetical protein [Bacillus cereus]MCS6595209.1 hypothetical protein [Bacillus cereus]
MIKGMHELGVPIETIAKASKLSIEEVEHILRGKMKAGEGLHFC